MSCLPCPEYLPTYLPTYLGTYLLITKEGILGTYHSPTHLQYSLPTYLATQAGTADILYTHKRKRLSPRRGPPIAGNLASVRTSLKWGTTTLEVAPLANPPQTYKYEVLLTTIYSRTLYYDLSQYTNKQATLSSGADCSLPGAPRNANGNPPKYPVLARSGIFSPTPLRLQYSASWPD
jgi:hypothetical protein